MKSLPSPQERGLVQVAPLPQSIESEMALLGCILINSELFAKTKEYITEKAFYRTAHKEIYKAMEELIAEGKDIDTVTVNDKLKQNGVHEDIGGAVYLASLINSVQSTAMFKSFLEIVLEKWKLRMMWQVTTKLTEKCLTGKFSDIGIEEFRNKIERIYYAKKDHITYKFGDGIQNILEDIDARRNLFLNGIPFSTTIPDLDKLTGGLEKKTLTVIGARSSIGKTSFCTQIAFNLALRGNTVAFFTSEMPEPEIRNRIMCSELSIDYFSTIRQGRIDDERKRRILQFMQDTKTLPLFIFFSPALTYEHLENEVDRIRPDFVFVDFIQQMKLPGRTSPAFEMSELCAKIKKLAGQANIGMIISSQFSRAMDNTERDIPRLSDLKESGGIEISGDLVLLMQRKHANSDGSEGHNNIISYDTYIWIGKQRNGPAGEVHVETLFLTRPMRIVQKERDHE